MEIVCCICIHIDVYVPHARRTRLVGEKKRKPTFVRIYIFYWFRIFCCCLVLLDGANRLRSAKGRSGVKCARDGERQPGEANKIKVYLSFELVRNGSPKMHIHCDETNIYTYYIVCSQDVTTVHFYILYYCFVSHHSIYTCTRSTCNSHIGLVVSECDRDTKHIAFSVQRRVEGLVSSSSPPPRPYAFCCRDDHRNDCLETILSFSDCFLHCHSFCWLSYLHNKQYLVLETALLHLHPSSLLFCPFARVIKAPLPHHGNYENAENR